MIKEAYILAGGKSSRMGEDKGLKIINNQEAIKYIIDVLLDLDLKIYIVTNNIKYIKFNCNIIEDIYKEKGPIGGIYSALKNTNFNNILILPCDMPLLKKEHINYLINNSKNDEINIIKNKNKIQPLIGVYPKNITNNLFKSINSNVLKIKDLLNNNNVNFIETNYNEIYFYNMNYPEDVNNISKNIKL